MARVAAADLPARLAKGEPIGCVALLGDEAYLRDSCRAQLIERLVPAAARDWSVSRFSAARGETETALSRSQTLPMLSPQQIIFLEDAQAIEKLGEEARERAVDSIAAYLDNPAPFTTLVLEATALDQRMKLGKLLAERALVVGVSLGEDENARRGSAVMLAQSMAHDLGVKIDGEAAEDLAEWVADDLMRMKTELEKLAAYAGERKQVGREDVSRLVVSRKKYSVWQFADLIAARQRARALEFLECLLREGDEPVRIVGAMAWMYRKLIEASELRGSISKFQAAGQLGMRADSAELAIRNARRMSRERLREGLRALQRSDDHLKGGAGRDARAVLEFLVSELTGTST